MGRNTVIDGFRGLDMLEMQATEVCKSLAHAEYDDMTMTYADTIFPCFSFISGMTMRLGAVPIRKNMQLIGLGVAFNAIPLLSSGERVRFLGVLQRHGLSSILLNLIPFRFSVWCPVALTAIWSSISFFYADDPKDPFKDPKSTAQQKLDYPIFGTRTYHANFDPEGLLGALMTSVTIWSGWWWNKQNLDSMSLWKELLVGALFYGGGKLLARLVPKYFPVSKPLWTPSFVMTSNGWSIMKYALFKAAIPYLPEFVVTSLALVGKYSLEVYFFGEIFLLSCKPHAIVLESAAVAFAYACNYFNLRIRMF